MTSDITFTVPEWRGRANPSVRATAQHGVVDVRRAEARDFDAVTALLEELGRAVVTEETEAQCRRVFLAQLEEEGAGPLVVEDGGRVVGCCSLHFRPRLNRPTPDAWIPDLIVTAAARRRGAARALLEESERRARARGCWSLTLESGHGRKEAHVLYGAFGMSEHGFYFGKSLE
jgi:GNAT superfamily N-acetyltransferase